MSTYKFKTTNIKGKQYVEVNERIKFFRQEDQYKNWGIQTDFPMLASDEVVCKCTITDTDGMVVAQGHAHELKANGMINKTSFVENCETSAVGRALAMLGIGVDTSIASAKEEFKQTAKNMQENVMDKAVSYIKSQTNKQKAFDSIITKYGNDLTAKQQAGLKKFVR